MKDFIKYISGKSINFVENPNLINFITALPSKDIVHVPKLQ